MIKFKDLAISAFPFDTCHYFTLRVRGLPARPLLIAVSRAIRINIL
jgi:hypothetical protein